jgi:hypothetical protein
MKLTKLDWMRAARLLAGTLLGLACAWLACAQGVTTTTVQGTVYLANGQSGSGTVLISWPSFTTAGGSLVAAGTTTATIAADGFLSVNLAPNLGSTPAGLFYTAVFHMSDGSTSTQYWVVPAAAQASLAAVQSQVMPAVQAVQAVNKAYVDQAIQSITSSTLSPTGGTLTGPLYLSGDPTQSLQAADKHYVDASFSQALPLTGGTLTGPVTATQIGAAIQVDQMPGADFGAKLQSCLAKISTTYGGTCDARNFSGALSMASSVTISTANTTILLPCATINTANQILVAAGTRNVAFRGCSLRGSSAASGTLGGTVFAYTGSAAMIQVGDPTYATDTQGFHLDNAVLNTTGSTSATAQGLIAYRTQELDLQSLYFQGNANQTGITLDGTGNYTGGTFYDNAFTGFLTAVNAIGHQVANPATTDWLNASTFVRLHIDCPTSSGNPIAGTTGINLAQGDGNTFTGGDVEGCSTALHLGPNAQNNTIVGLRNENSASQIVADAGSSYNNWITGGTMFTGKLTDNGTRNSFLDTFHRSFNGLTGDWYGSQQDATVTNHFRLGTGAGNERGLYNRYQTDSGYRWTTGLSDATAGEQFYQVLDELNNVYRLSIGQFNTGQSSTNNQTVLNAAGTGAVVLNGSNNSGTGGVIFGSGGPSETTVATIDSAGNAQFNGTLRVAGTSTFVNSPTVRNSADAEIDAFLWAGATVNQKESFIYKDYTGASQWYMVKDASNNWALNSATGGLDSFKAYQSTNSGDTYINAANATGHIRLNYETGSGAETDIYSGSSANLVAAFLGATAIKFPGLAAASGHNCLQIDNSGYITNTGAACGTGGTTGTVNSGTAGQIAFYSASGTAISGVSAVPVSAGGTGATTSAGALAALGGASLSASTAQSFNAPLAAPAVTASINNVLLVTAPPYNAKCDGSTIDTAAIQAAFNAAAHSGAMVEFPAGTCKTGTIDLSGGKAAPFPIPFFGHGMYVTIIQGLPGQDVFAWPDNTGSTYFIGTFHDLTIRVDASVDASGPSGSFPNRISGTAGGTTAITPAIAPAGVAFNPADGLSGAISTSTDGTYDKFTISGGNMGLTLIPSSLVVGTPLKIPSLGINATITSVLDANDVTFTPAYTAAASSLSGTMLNGLTPPWYVGNCGLAFPASNGTYSAGTFQDIFRNIRIESDNAPAYSNHTCGIFFQQQPYAATFENISIYQTFYGYVEALPTTNYSGITWTPDTASYKNFSIAALIPWVSYAGNHRTINGLSIYGTNTPLTTGPWFLPGPMNSAGGSTVSHIYYECFTPNTGEDERWTGVNWTVTGGAIGQCPEEGYVNWLAHDSTVDATIGPNIQIGGWQNKFTHTDFYHDSQTVTDNGYSNEVVAGLNQANMVQSARAWEADPIPPQDPLGKLDGSFLALGTTQTPFLNASDLVTTCRDWEVSANPTATNPVCVNDPTGTEISKTYQKNTGTQDPYNGWANADVFDPVGTRFPTTKMYVVLQGRCLGTTSCTATLTFGDQQTSQEIGPQCPITFTSTWSMQGGPNSANPCLLDLSTFPVGHTLGWGFWNFSGSPTEVDVAVVAFEPVNQDVLTEVRLTGTTGSIGGSALTAGTCATGTATIQGATTSMVAEASPVTYPGAAFEWNAYVSAANTVTVSVCTNLAAGGTPTASVYNVRVLQ